jgi:apolipoprotein N-acyltransferase
LPKKRQKKLPNEKKSPLIHILRLAALAGLAAYPLHNVFFVFRVCSDAAGDGKHHPIHLGQKGETDLQHHLLGFVIWNTLCVYWVYNSLKIIGPVVAVPISIIPYTLGPLLMSTACWLYYRLRLKTNRTIGLIGLVCFWIGYEYLHQSWDLNFPWMTLGNGFAVSHQWVQWYEYTGVYGGTIWIWAANILLFLIYVGLREAQTKQTQVKLIVSLTLVLVVPLGISLTRYYSYRGARKPGQHCGCPAQYRPV